MTDPSRMFAWVAMIVGAFVIAVSVYSTVQIREIANGIAEPLPSERPPPPPPPPPPPAEKPAPPELRPVDKLVFRFVERPQQELRRNDVEPKESFRVDILAKSGRVVGAEIDLDRDGRYDERWTLYDPENMHFDVTRDVSPADDGAYTEHFRWESGWKPDEAPADETPEVEAATTEDAPGEIR